ELSRRDEGEERGVGGWPNRYAGVPCLRVRRPEQRGRNPARPIRLGEHTEGRGHTALRHVERQGRLAHGPGPAEGPAKHPIREPRMHRDLDHVRTLADPLVETVIGGRIARRQHERRRDQGAPHRRWLTTRGCRRSPEKRRASWPPPTS